LFIYIVTEEGTDSISWMELTTGFLGSEIFPAVEMQLKLNADQISEKAKQICASKSVVILWMNE